MIPHRDSSIPLGQFFEAVVLKSDAETEQVSLSVKQLQPDPWSLVSERYPVGQTVRGKIRKAASFGVFVELEEGVDGLAHVSQISNLDEILELQKNGAEVEVVIVRVSPEEKKIAVHIPQVGEKPPESTDTGAP